MAELTYTARQIAPAGRNKYGHYMSVGNITQSVVSTTYGGNGSTTTIADTGTTGGDVDNISFYCVLSKSNYTFDALDLVNVASAETEVIAYRGYTKAPTLICDMERVTATTVEGIITDLSVPANMGVVLPNGINMTLNDNGTSAATIVFRANNMLSGNTGTIKIPVVIYKRSDAVPVGDDVYDWYDSQEDCEQVWLDFVWNVNRVANTNYVMDLSNQSAQVNCDTNGNLYDTSIATLQCTATTYYNGAPATNIKYSATTQSYFGATGFSINTNTGVLTFNSGTTNQFFWSTHYPSLPIDIVAYEGSVAPENVKATKTMTITRNYPGSQGEPATMWWIETDKNYLSYNPKTGQYSSQEVTGTVYKQVGSAMPVADADYTIWQWYNDNESGRSFSSGTFTAPVVAGTSAITFALQTSNAHEYYEVEDVLVIPEGTEGPQGPAGGEGPQGPQGVAGDAGESNWYLTLDNDNASVNANHDGTIPATSILPSCRCRLYYGQTLQSGSSKTFDLTIKQGSTTITPSSIGINITQTSSGAEITLTQGTFQFTGTSLAILVTGYKDNIPRDSKTFTITKSLAGANGDGVYVQWSTDGTNWHDNYQNGDLYMRQYVDGAWSSAIRVVGEAGPQGPTGGEGPQGPAGDTIYTSTIFKSSYSKPATPTTTSPIPEHEQHTAYTATYVSTASTSYWTKDGNVFTHSRSSYDVLKITLNQPNGYGNFRVRSNGGTVYLTQSGSTEPQDWNKAAIKTDTYALYKWSGSTGNVNYYFRGAGDVSVEILTPDSYEDTDWQDAPIPATASTVEYSAAGDWTYSNGFYVSPTGTNLTALERFDFTTTENNQIIGLEGSIRAEKNYDYMVITAPDITNQQLSAITATSYAAMSMSANTIIGYFTGIHNFTQSITIPVAGNHTIYVMYKTDGSTDWGGGSIKIVSPQRPMWFSMAQVEDGVAGEWSEPQKIGYEAGQPAVSYWLEASSTSSILDTDSGITPQTITASVMKQVGGYAAMPALDAEIRYSKLTRGSLDEGPTTAYTTGITLSVEDFRLYQKIKLYAIVDGITRDTEEIDLLKDGKDGIQGRNGYAIRGPYSFVEYETKSKLWCNGQEDTQYPDSVKFLDILYKDGNYYYCNHTYQGTADYGWQMGWFTHGDSYDFIAAGLILASGASINFLTNNELYLRDANNQITGGAAGGSGITFWAGNQTPGAAPFQVNASGEVIATKGVIGGWKYDSTGLDWASYDGVENFNDAWLNDQSMGVSYRGAGSSSEFHGGLNGISYSTEHGSHNNNALYIGGNGITPITFEGDGIFTCEKKMRGSIYDDPIKINGLEVDKDITFNYGTERVVGTPYATNSKIAFVTSTYSSGTYFSAVIVPYDNYEEKHWYFNGDMDLGISAQITNGNPYMIYGTTDMVNDEIIMWDWGEISANTYHTKWRNGGSANDYIVDVIRSGSTYYRCITYYTGWLNWNTHQNYWTSGSWYTIRSGRFYENNDDVGPDAWMQGIPYRWVGMWLATSILYSSKSSYKNTYNLVPTGIYAPNVNKKGDTLYFEV